MLQFAERPAPSQREAMAQEGVELLRYVPEDSFIARCKQVNLATLKQRWGVTWIGRYGAEHKMHQSLAAPAAGLADTGDLQVAVLVHPRSTGAEKTGVRGRFKKLTQESESRLGSIYRGHLNRGDLQALANSDAVIWIEPTRPMRMFDEVASKLVAGDAGPGRLLTQDMGYDGSGVTVAVADSGLDGGNANLMHPDLAGRTPAFFHYGTNVLDAADEHSHGTHVAGIVAGNAATGETDENGALYGLGVAPGANIVAQRIFDGIGNYEAPPSFERLTRDAVRVGADIGSNSWGDDTHGRYDLSAMEFDELVRDADGLTLGDQQYILEFSAGNAGPLEQTIGSPAVAKNVIATGASQNDRVDFLIYGDGPETMADFSSRGPCEDGRIKPDIVAPGTYIASLQSSAATDEYAWAPISPYYQYQGGTSQAGPHASGAAAVFVQYYRQTHGGQTPSPALVKAALINATLDLDDSFGTLPVPNNDEGWGRLDLSLLFEPGLDWDMVDSVSLANSQVFTRQILVSSSDSPLKVTMTYTDVPGFPGAVKALVNDLDLEVIAPDGSVYRGNQFSDSESVPNALGWDRVNNVEGVYLWEPKPGMYLVRVHATAIVEDALRATPAVDQDFALVTSAAIPPSGTGLITFDRKSYRVPDQIRIQVADSDLAQQNTVSINLRSTTEPTGEQIVLQRGNLTGVFTGTVATVTGPAVTDGKLQLQHGNLIEARYSDASAGQLRVASALADFVPPVLTLVSNSSEFGLVFLSWATDEPASGIIRFGTNANFAAMANAVTNSAFDLEHTVALSGLEPWKLYYFYIVSTDAAGNTVTNLNGGAFYSFFVAPAAAVLLVDAFSDMLGGTENLPLSGYTNALNELGVTYSTWSVTNRGSPNLNVLSAHQAVIWRLPEVDGTWSAAERVTISNYLNSGGSLLVASMEVFSRLEEAGAADFYQTVLHVESHEVDPGNVSEIIGGPDPVTAGINTDLDYEPYEILWEEWIALGFLNADSSDPMVPKPTASPILRTALGDTVGIRWPGFGQQAPGRLVLLSFPLDAVPMTGPNSPRVELLRHLMSFLAPGSGGKADISLNSSSYRLPSRVAVQVGDSDLIGQGTTTVTAQSPTQPAPITVPLQETSRKGLFTGAFDLIAATNPPAAGVLRAQDGEILTVSYFDASSGETKISEAVVDMGPPSIQNVGSEADYVTTFVYWDTSELTDATVQFGESPFLGRTVSSPTLDEYHELTLTGLLPDKTYYYQVVSRDAAGNATVDNNGGQLYTFTTLRPEMTPWADDLESGATNWTVFSDPSTTIPGVTPVWELGVPQNQIATSAHSPQNAWGCNLTGQASDLVETFLISPAIYITNGNVATLRFWHNFDFSPLSELDLFEAGELLLILDDQSQVALAEYGDFSLDWEEETINLSPYTGRVVYLVWHYVLFSFEALPRPGWLVDDVSISVSSVAPGTVLLSNNIPQASFILSGGAYRKASGAFYSVSNAPPGEYMVEYADVPGYQTPSPQTGTLPSGGTIVFQGNYVSLDANANGIPDSWEYTYFGIVSTNRTQATDSDGDGKTDYQEYLAGTDPTSPLPPLVLKWSRNGSMLRFEWPTIIGWNYRLLSGVSPEALAPMGAWTQALTNKLVLEVPIVNTAGAQFFRVEGAGPANRPVTGGLRLKVEKQAGGGLRLSWPSEPGKQYQVESTASLGSWTPLSTWLPATQTNMSYTISGPLTGPGTFYRLSAQ